MKPMHAKWLIDLYNEFTSAKGQEIVINGWKASVIYEAVEMGSTEMQPLDPFAEIDPIHNTMSNVDFNAREEFPPANHPNVNIRSFNDSSDGSEYELDIEDTFNL